MCKPTNIAGGPQKIVCVWFFFSEKIMLGPPSALARRGDPFFAGHMDFCGWKKSCITLDGWWLYTHPSEKYMTSSIGFFWHKPKSFLGKCQIHGNQLPPTSWDGWNTVNNGSYMDLPPINWCRISSTVRSGTGCLGNGAIVPDNYSLDANRQIWKWNHVPSDYLT